MRACHYSRGLRRTLQLLLGVLVLFVAGEAAAASAVAGMCDPIGASAPAPLPAMPARDGAIDVLDDCDQLFSDFGDGAPVDDTASLEAPQDSPKPAFVAGFVLARRPGTRMPAPDGAEAGERTGYQSGVFRPPRG